MLYDCHICPTANWPTTFELRPQIYNVNRFQIARISFLLMWQNFLSRTSNCCPIEHIAPIKWQYWPTISSIINTNSSIIVRKIVTLPQLVCIYRIPSFNAEWAKVHAALTYIENEKAQKFILLNFSPFFKWYLNDSIKFQALIPNIHIKSHNLKMCEGAVWQIAHIKSSQV